MDKLRTGIAPVHSPSTVVSYLHYHQRLLTSTRSSQREISHAYRCSVLRMMTEIMHGQSSRAWTMDGGLWLEVFPLALATPLPHPIIYETLTTHRSSTRTQSELRSRVIRIGKGGNRETSFHYRGIASITNQDFLDAIPSDRYTSRYNHTTPSHRKLVVLNVTHVEFQSWVLRIYPSPRSATWT